MFVYCRSAIVVVHVRALDVDDKIFNVLLVGGKFSGVHTVLWG